MPGHCLSVTVGATACCCRIAVLSHCRTAAGIARCRRRKAWCRRAFNRAIGCWIGQYWWRIVQHGHRPALLRAGVAARIHCVPGHCLRVTVGTTARCCRIAVLYYCGAAAGIARCRRGKAWCGRALNRAIGCWIGWSLVAYCPTRSLSGSFARWCCRTHPLRARSLSRCSCWHNCLRCRIAVLHHGRTAAGITGRRCGKARCGRAFNRAIGCWIGQYRRRVVQHGHRTALVRAGVPACIHCVPGHCLTVTVRATARCCRIAVLHYCGSPHASEAVGAVKLGVAGHSTVPLAAGSASTGGVLSSTVTVRLFCALVFPHASTACQVTVSE